MKKALLVAFLFPLGIEVFQFVAGRIPDVDDIVCNFVGTMFGYYIHAYASFIWKLPFGTKIETRVVKGKDISKYFPAVLVVLYFVMGVRVVTLG